MLKGFKEFLLRGNVIDLAIAVVIGTAFTSLVTAVVADVINPLVAAVGGDNVDGLAHRLVRGNPKSVIDLGAVISAVITFVVTAAVVYFALVVPMRRVVAARAPAPAEQAPAVPEDVVLLRQIRDLLVADRTTPGRTTPGPDGDPTG